MKLFKYQRKISQLRDRVIDVLNSRFGLDGSPAKTLEIIGQKYNVTRSVYDKMKVVWIEKIKIFKTNNSNFR